MAGTSLAMIEEKYRKVFIDFLNYLIDTGVDNSDDYNEAIKTYQANTKIYPLDFDKAILESAKWVSNTLTGFKSTKWDEKDVFEAKKGFDILYQYAPQEIKSIIDEGGQKVLDIYSYKFAKQATSSISSFAKELYEKAKVDDQKLLAYNTESVVDYILDNYNEEICNSIKLRQIDNFITELYDVVNGKFDQN